MYNLIFHQFKVESFTINKKKLLSIHQIVGKMEQYFNINKNKNNLIPILKKKFGIFIQLMSSKKIQIDK